MQTFNSNRPLVFKVGGTFFDDQDAQKDFFAALCMLLAQGKKLIVVHGGGAQVQQQLHSLGFESVKHKGLRVTPQEHMPIVTGVLAGTLNKCLVNAAQKEDIQAVGLSLADGDFCICTQVSKELGCVGEPHPQNDLMLNTLLGANYLPVISSIGRDNLGQLYNVNADQAATCIAQVLDADLFLLSDVEGVLDSNRELVSKLDNTLMQDMINSNVIVDGMQVKVEAAQQAANTLNRPVTVASWNSMSKIVCSNQKSVGTQILPANLAITQTDDSALVS